MFPTTFDSVNAPVVQPAVHPAELRTLLAELLPALLQEQGALLTVKEAASGRYVHVNPAMAEFLGLAPERIVGRCDAELHDAPLAAVLRAADQTALAQDTALASDHRFDWQGLRREFRVVRLAAATGAGAGGTARRWLLAVWQDRGLERRREQQLRAALEQIEQQQQANELLRREIADQALRDPASGLYRRAHFEDQLRREIDLCTREQREFAVVFVEIDAPSAAVQSMGEEGRQAVLQAMGRLLRGGTRAMDASCRYDECRFAVLLSGVGLATAHARMDDLRRRCVAQIVVHGGREMGFSVAMGVASFPHTAQEQEALLQSCESALVQAQRRGGNRVALASIPFEPPADGA